MKNNLTNSTKIKMINTTQTNKNTYEQVYTTLIFVLATLLSISILSTNANALELSLSPGDINFNNVLNGGYAEMPFTLLTDSIENITINLFNLNDSIVNDWITYDPKPEFITISQAKPYVGKVVLRVPQSATSGAYSVLNKFTILRPLSPTQSDTQADITLSMGQKIFISVVSDEITGCTIYSDSLQSQAVVGQDIVESLFLRNDGNIDLSDSLNYKIYNINKTSIISSGSIPINVLPTRVETLLLNLDTKTLPVGQYVVSINAEKCAFAKENLQFTLFAQGEKIVKGEFLLTEVPKVREYNLTPTLVKGEFTNTGEIATTAHMISKVTLSGKIVDIVETQSTLVDVGKKASFTNEVKPKAFGRHQIDSYVVYGLYQTPKITTDVNFIEGPADTSTNLASSTSEDKNSSTSLGKIIILCVIVVLVVLIIIKKKKTKKN